MTDHHCGLTKKSQYPPTSSADNRNSFQGLSQYQYNFLSEDPVTKSKVVVDH